MDDIDDEAAYLLQRAHQEREQASVAVHPKATAAHKALAERYATRAFLVQVEAGEREQAVRDEGA